MTLKIVCHYRDRVLCRGAHVRRRDGVSGTLDMDGAMGGGAAGGAPPLMQGSLKPRLANPSGCAAIALPCQLWRLSAGLQLTR